MTRPSKRRSSAPGRVWLRGKLAEAWASDQADTPRRLRWTGTSDTLSNQSALRSCLGARQTRWDGLWGRVLCPGPSDQLPPSPLTFPLLGRRKACGPENLTCCLKTDKTLTWKFLLDRNVSVCLGFLVTYELLFRLILDSHL